MFQPTDNIMLVTCNQDPHKGETFLLPVVSLFDWGQDLYRVSHIDKKKKEVLWNRKEDPFFGKDFFLELLKKSFLGTSNVEEIMGYTVTPASSFGKEFFFAPDKRYLRECWVLSLSGSLTKEEIAFFVYHRKGHVRLIEEGGGYDLSAFVIQEYKNLENTVFVQVMTKQNIRLFKPISITEEERKLLEENSLIFESLFTKNLNFLESVEEERRFLWEEAQKELALYQDPLSQKLRKTLKGRK